MNLIKEHWTKKDIQEFQKYLLTFSKGKEKGKWEQRIVNTNLPCIAVPSQKIREIIMQIEKGNYLEFLNLWPWENFSNTTILGGLICKIKDFETQKTYLIKLSEMADNWATIDAIKIKPKINQVNNYLTFSKELLSNNHEFSRRLGIIIMLKMINDNSIDYILSNIKDLNNEKAYYVNMALAWLLAECFTKCREETLQFIIKHHNEINKFVMNKMISKCRDSYRISNEDKDMLINYRKK